MIQPYLVVLIFLSFCLLTTLANLLWVRRFEDYPDPKSFPRVSILVPARNEENNIESCLTSLLDQQYPDFEVLVLDDHSTDQTPIILRRLKIHYPHLCIIQGEPLPEDWLGKHWACHQLAQAAGGELFLFVDADTRHQPGMLLKAVGAMQKENADLITAFPTEEVLSMGEQLVVPVIAWCIHSFLPIRFAQELHWAELSLTIGQFMMFRRDVYQSVGGFESVRQNIIDDVALGRRVIREGYEWRLLDGTRFITCRMYRTFTSMVEGFSKNVFSFFDGRVLPFVIAWLLVGFMFLDPLLGVLSTPGRPSLTSFPPGLAMVAVLESLVLWLVAYHRFHFPAYLVLLYPISLVLFILIAFRSMLLTLAGRTVWKGREMKRGSIRWI